MLITIGIFLAVISMVSIYTAWGANEWREPLLYVSAIFKRQQNEQVTRLYSEARRREAILHILMLLLYIGGAILISTRFPADWFLTVEFIGFVWLAKAVMALLRTAYSSHVRLLNYLYSPYLLAWRRDSWSSYSDDQIANAICEASGIDPQKLSIQGTTLDDFLVALCRHARPEHEAQRYPDVLKELHAEANGMVRM